MKQFRIYVGMAGQKYCHDIISSSKDEDEQSLKEKAIKDAESILSKYKGDGVYCFVYIYDEEYNIIYEKDNLYENVQNEKLGDQITYEQIIDKGKANNICGCQLAEGFTKDGNRKYIRLEAFLTDKHDGINYVVYCCTKDMCTSIGIEYKTRYLHAAIEKYNKL